MIKKALLLFSLLLFIACLSFAQNGLQGMNYQAVARNATGGVVSSQAIKVKFNILTGSATGTTVYSEIHTTSTTAQGLFTLVIGKGTAQTGTFAGINWATANHYLHVEVDIAGGNNFITIGTTPFYSVPFALHAANSLPGPQGSAGIQGVQGTQGIQGIQGPAGATGAQGPVGATGPQGPAGALGPQGPVGDAGPQGPVGATGTQGPQGPAGTAGASIMNTFFDPWGRTVINFNGGVPAPITGLTAAWTPGGNLGINGNNNYIGPVDANIPFMVKIGGIGSSNTRLFINNNGQVAVNGSVGFPSKAFSVYGSGFGLASISSPGATDDAIGGYSTGSFTGIYGENNGTGKGVYGYNSATGYGVHGHSTGTGAGVYGTNGGGGPAIAGLATGINGGHGVSGSTNGTASAGVLGINGGSGIGIIGKANASSLYWLPPAGLTGVVANGYQVGLFAVAGVGSGGNGPGVGIMAGGRGTTTITVSGLGEGICGNAPNYGVTGFGTGPGSGSSWGGYFESLSNAGSATNIGGRTGNTNFGILSSGTKSTIVKDEQNRGRIMFCPEAPEVLFQDYGNGELKNGFAHIILDPLLVRNIRVDEKHPLKVFIQLEGDCNGVFVTNKTPNGFDVKELQSGRSNVSFTWQIVASRADDKDETGKITSEFSDIRFPVAPEPLQKQVIKSIAVKE